MANYQLLQNHYFKGPAAETPAAPQVGQTGDFSELTASVARLQTLKKSGVMAADIALMLLRFSKLIVNPNDISPIFKGRSFLKHKSFQVSLKAFYADPATAALMRSRYLSPAPYDLAELKQLPAGSLGHTYADHMLANKLEVVFYPPMEYTEDDDIAYLRQRARQTHDVHHVVLGFPAIDAGEMAISAFYLSQYNVPLSALLIGFGFLYTILRTPERIEELMKVIEHGWKVGKQTPKFFGIKWEDYWEIPIEEVRRQLNIPSSQHIFA